jgi:hypothetical protein
MAKPWIELREARGKTVKRMTVSYDADYCCVEVEFTNGQNMAVDIQSAVRIRPQLQKHQDRRHQDSPHVPGEGLGGRGVPVKFSLGQIVSTPAALAALEEAGEEPLSYLQRHQCGDWGQVCAEDVAENELSLAQGFRLLSSYKLRTGVVVWCITEADRSSTCLLLPSEY